MKQSNAVFIRYFQVIQDDVLICGGRAECKSEVAAVRHFLGVKIFLREDQNVLQRLLRGHARIRIRVFDAGNVHVERTGSGNIHAQTDTVDEFQTALHAGIFVIIAVVRSVRIIR